MNFRIFKEKILFSLFLFLTVFLIYHFKDKVKNTVYLIYSPFEASLFNFSKKIINFYGAMIENISLKKENERLKLEIKRLIAENEKLKELKIENEEMRKALRLELEKIFDFKMARFIGKDVSGDFLRVDKGSEDGIKEGMVVITPENCLVGRIFKVYSNFSAVQVFTDKDFSFDAKISEKNISVLVKGQGNFKAEIEFVPKEENLTQGDKVLTSPLGGKFPAGILVGEIEEIEKSDITFYQEVRLKPAFEIRKLDYLLIILNF